MISALWCHGPGGEPRGKGSWGPEQNSGGFLGNKISTLNHSLTSSKRADDCFISSMAVAIALRAQLYHMRFNTAFVA